MKISDLVYSIWTILKQNFDDGELTQEHILFWVLMNSNAMRAQSIEKGLDISSDVRVFSSVPVLIDTATGRKYSELPASIMVLNKNRGVNYISYNYLMDDNRPAFGSILFNMTTQTKARILYYNEDEKPSATQPYAYVVSLDNQAIKRIYYLGIENINILAVEMGLLVTTDLSNVDINGELDLPDHLIPILTRQILDLGRLALLLPADWKNDGANSLNQQSIPTSKITSVNQQTGTQQQMMEE